MHPQRKFAQPSIGSSFPDIHRGGRASHSVSSAVGYWVLTYFVDSYGCREPYKAGKSKHLDRAKEQALKMSRNGGKAWVQEGNSVLFVYRNGKEALIGI